MGGSSDGSIVIDTELDREGFEQGTDKLLSAVKDLTQAVENLGGNMTRSFEKMLPVLQTVANTTAEISEKMGAAATQTTQATNDLASGMDRVTASAGNAQRATGNYDTALAKLQQKIDAQKAKLSDYYEQVAAIQQSTDSSLREANTDDQAARIMEIEEIQLQKLNEKYAAKLKVLHDLEAEYQRLAAAQQQAQNPDISIPPEAIKNATQLAEVIEQLKKSMAEAEAKLQTMKAPGGIGEASAGYQQTAASLLEMAARLAEYESLAEQFDTITEPANESEQSLKKVDQELQKKPKDAQAASSAFQKFGSVLRSIGSAALKVVGTLAKIPFQATAKGIKLAAEKMKGFVTQARKATLTSNGLVKALTSVKRMLISRVKRMFISQIFNGMKEALQTLAKFSDTFNSAMSNIKNSAKELSGNLAVSFGNLITAIEPVLTQIINALSKAITYINAFFALLSGKTTMTVAKKQTDSYRDSLDGAAKSAEDLKNQVYSFDELNKRSDKDSSGGADDGSDLFEEVPIDSVIPEEIKKFLDELKDLWENQEFFDFGKKLAEALNSILQTADDWINNVFRPKGVEWAGNIAEILNGLVDGFDWELLGKTVADGLNAIFDIVNTFLTKFDFEALGKGIGEAINGLFDNVEWDLIGQTFANGWNALVDLVFGLVNEIDWATIGDSIAEAVQSFFDTIDWDKTAATISTAINGIVEAFSHFVNGVDWNKIGNDIGGAITSLFTGIDWGAAFQAVIDGFSALEGLILGVIQGINWGEVARSLGEGINGIDLTKALTTAAQIVNDFIMGVLDFATQLIETIDWSALTQNLWDSLVGIVESIDFTGLVEKAFELLGAAIGALASIAVTLGENIWNILKEAWEGVKAYFSEYIDAFGGDVIAGFFAGIINALVNIGAWIVEHIFQPFIDGFKKAFGINSPSTVMMEMGKYLIEGLLQGIKNVWNTITQFFTTAVNGLKTLLSNAWNTIKSTATTAWEGIRSAISNKFNEVKTNLTNTIYNIKSTLSTAWNNVKSTATSTWDGIKSSVTQKFNEVKSSLTNTVNNIKSTLSTAWSSIKATATSTWDGIKSSVIQKFNEVKSSLSNTVNNIKSALSTAWNNIKSTATSTWDSIKSSVTQKFNEVKSSLSNTANNIKSDIVNAWNQLSSSTSQSWNSLKNTVVNLWNGLKSALQQTDWASVGSNLVSGLQSGIQSAWGWLRSTVSSLASSLTSGLRSIFGIHSPSKAWAEIGEYLDEGLQEGLESQKREVLHTVANLAESVNDELGRDKAMLQIDTASNGLVTELSGVTAKLAEIVTAFRSINAALSDMGGLKIPVIAEGGEVPYKTRVSSETTNPVLELSGALDERLSDQSYLLRQILDLLERARLGVDNEELASALAFALRGATRGFGGV